MVRPQDPPEVYERYDTALELHLLRFAAQMSLAQFSQHIGCTKDHLWKVERNRRNMTIGMLDKAARAFGLRVKITFERAEEQDGLSLSQAFYDSIRSQDGSQEN